MAEKNVKRTVFVRELKHGDIIKFAEDGSEFLVRVRAIDRDANGIGLGREISVQSRGEVHPNAGWSILKDLDQKVLWVSQTNEILPYQLYGKGTLEGIQRSMSPTKRRSRLLFWKGG
jgi:hypothetical protein